jgi:glycosyltransferase involved in cell wall biosynthesis
MLISFIIPTYNRARLLGRAVDSVLSEVGTVAFEAEVVIADDGSTDNTGDVLVTYGDRADVRIIRFSENRGGGAARTAAFEVARGRWCALLDSDNALLPGALERLGPADVGVLWTHSVDVGGSSTVPHEITGRVRGIDMLRNGLPGEHFSVVRTELARAHPYPKLGTRHPCEPAFWARMALVTDFWLSAERLQFYETTGEDRLCALDTRLARAHEYVACYQETARLVRSAAPAHHWSMRGKAALYQSVQGRWGASVREALRLIPGIPHAWQNLAVLASCIAGPSASRWLLRQRSAFEST